MRNSVRIWACKSGNPFEIATQPLFARERQPFKVSLESNANLASAPNGWLDGSHHSDSGKFCNNFNRQKSGEISEWLLITLGKFGDFQAEYERSTAPNSNDKGERIFPAQPSNYRRILLCWTAGNFSEFVIR